MIWGAVYAADEGGRAFWLNAREGPTFPGHRPGHSWLLTPSWRVADLALVHQFDVPGDYNDINATLPPIITITSSEASEPDVNWWRLEGGDLLTSDEYVQATRYHDVIGWSQHQSGPTTVRYLPGATTLPVEAELGDINIKIGGLSPRKFFDRHASDLLPS